MPVKEWGEAEFFESSIDHLCVAGFDGYWKRLNPSWTRTLGWTEAEMLSRPLIEFVHPDDREATLAGRQGLHQGQPLRGLTNRYRCKDGTYRWFEWRSVSNVERGLVYAIARDVTAEKEAQRAFRELAEKQEALQKQLILADRLASVGTLAAGVAHEINNPLAYVVANLEMLIEEFGTVSPQTLAERTREWTELAREARQGCERIRKIVRGLMTFSRSEAERRAVVDLRSVLDVAINMTSNEIRHRANMVRDYGHAPLVEADESRLGQVFINLLVNAAHAIPAGNAGANEIRVVTSGDADGRAVVEIRDTGPGIPPDVLGRIFDPFFTTKPIGVGTGLGLSICHSIVSAMGGEITAASREGGGAVFRVVLPPAPDRAAQPEKVANARAEASARPASVLVVDDERAVGATIARLLRGHDVTAVTSAKQALELLLADRHFDLVLADLMMPEMSGMELHEHLERVRPHVLDRVVFITAGAFTPEARSFLERVPNERIQKPFDAATLRALVARFAK